MTATLEVHTNHPLATTLVKYAKGFNIENFFTATNVQNVTGKSIQGEIANIVLVKVGNLAFAQMMLPQDLLNQNVWQIASLLAVSINDMPIAFFALADALKPDNITSIQVKH